jgi:hypothetical protein
MKICPKKEMANQMLKMVCGARMADILSRGLALEKKYKFTDVMMPITRVWL